MKEQLTVSEIYSWLEEVKDPEIPVISIVDLGVVSEVRLDNDHVRVELSPTFTGCPAIEMMKSEVIETLKRKGIKNPVVEISFRIPWSSELISEKGKKALKNFGLAPPPSNKLFTDLEILENAICPRCNGINTVLKNPFGPTLCRSIHFCDDCREAFEQFKPL